MKQILFLLAVLLVAGCDGGGEAGAVGSTASDFRVETLSIPSVGASLAKKRGKVVLLDFWATWCGPCRQISPALEEIYEKHKERGLEAMAITTEARETVAINEKLRPHAIPVYLDAKGQATEAFGAHSLPTIAVVDREGQIVYQSAGVSENTAQEVADAVTKALGKA